MNLADLVGIPYKVHGRDESGLDCYGLIWLISQRNKTPIRDPVYKGTDPALVKLAEYVGLKKCEDGKVLEMVKDGRLHLGYLLDDMILHCTFNEGVILEPMGKYEIKGRYIWA